MRASRGAGPTLALTPSDSAFARTYGTRNEATRATSEDQRSSGWPRFAPDAADWWWGRTDASGALRESGEIGYCVGCHAGANAEAFVFGVATYLFWRRDTSWRNTAPPLAAALSLAA